MYGIFLAFHIKLKCWMKLTGLGKVKSFCWDMKTVVQLRSIKRLVPFLCNACWATESVKKIHLYPLYDSVESVSKVQKRGKTKASCMVILIWKWFLKILLVLPYAVFQIFFLFNRLLSASARLSSFWPDRYLHSTACHTFWDFKWFFVV